MAVYGKYSLVEADTAAARQRHRVLIEKALREMDLTPEQRLELEWELKRALEQEFSATQDEDAESEDAKEKGGDGDAGHGGKSGGSGGGGGGLSPDREASDSAQEANDVELLEILFFLAEMDANQISAPDVTVPMPDLESSLAAATVLFNRSTHTAHIHEPYGALDDGLHPSVDLLPALEGHTAQLGAQELHVRVHPDAVDLFRTKLGYVAYGRTVRRGGVQVQLMRKVLNDMAVPKCTLS